MILAEAPSIDVSAHAELATWLMLSAVGAVALLLIVRPELWRRLVMDRVDPRPAGLLRIAFGLTTLWTFVDLLAVGRFLFTDEGMWLTTMARSKYGGQLRTLWDPEHGFEGPRQFFTALYHGFSLLHFRSDPPFVYGLWSIMIAALVATVVGFKSRTATVIAWILVEAFYRHNPIFYTGGDTVTRSFLFLGVFCRWGEAYSIDSWLRRRRALMAGSPTIPPLRFIPVWPQRLMVLQLACIYCATGALKDGDTWRYGTALYYALNLDHFYRYPMTGVITFLQWLGTLRIMTWVVRWWEMLFPIVLVGMVLTAWERERAAGTWPTVGRVRRWLTIAVGAFVWGVASWILGLCGFYYGNPAQLRWPELEAEGLRWLVTVAVAIAGPLAVVLYLRIRRHRIALHVLLRWILGRRFWLGMGIGTHIGIDLAMNVGTFSEVMMSTYFAWLSADDVDATWRLLATTPCRPGESTRPIRRGWRRILAPIDRLRHRKPRPVIVVTVGADEHAIRRAAKLRMLDPCGRLEFVAEPHDGDRLAFSTTGPLGRGGIAAALCWALPILWPLVPVCTISPALGERIARRLRTH